MNILTIDNKNIVVAIPSYKRPSVKTLKYLPFATVFVSQSEEESYRVSNDGISLEVMPDEVQGSIARVRNYILNKCFDDPDIDYFAVIDDDMTEMFYFENAKKVHLEADDFLEFILKYSQLCESWGLSSWGVNLNGDSQNYRTMTPFSTVSPVLAPFTAFVRDNGNRYDESIPLKEDYDYFIQNCNVDRGMMRVNKYCYVVKQSEQPGGAAAMRNRVEEERQLLLLRKKWGSSIVRIDQADRSHKSEKVRKKVDYNPVIHIPIKGV